MNTFSSRLVAFVLGTLSMTPFVAHADGLGCSSMVTRCMIWNQDQGSGSYGGLNTAFERDEAMLRAKNIPLEIYTSCYSSCAVSAARLQPNVCIGPQAKLFFHKSRRYIVDGAGKPIGIYSESIPENLPKNVLALIAAKNGWQPADWHTPRRDFIEIDFDEAKAIWPVCKS